MRLVGRHIEFVPLKMEHVDALYEIGKAPEIWKFLQCRIETRSQMADWVADALRGRDENSDIPFAVKLRADHRVVGVSRLQDYVPEHRQIELGWTWGSRNLYNGAYAAEGMFLLLRYCFEELDVVRVQMTTDARNRGLRRMVERLGGKLDGVLRKHRILPGGYVRDSAYYSILDDEWPEVERRLIDLLQSKACDSVPATRNIHVGAERRRISAQNGDRSATSP